MNNLILVRHGQSLWNKERRFTGFADIDLTEQGKLEAKNAGIMIKDLNIEFDAYFTSQLKRAVNTLKIILGTINKNNVNSQNSDLDARPEKSVYLTKQIFIASKKFRISSKFTCSYTEVQPSRLQAL